MTLWPWPLTFWPLGHVALCRLGGQSLYIPSLKWIWFTVPELRLQFSIASLKAQFLRFLEVKGVRFKSHLFNPQKAVPWPVRHIMTYCAWVCVQRCDLWPRWSSKQKRNFHASNWLFAKTTHLDIAPWNCVCGVVSGKQLYISSFMKIGWGVSELWWVENHPLLLTWPMAFTTACRPPTAPIYNWHIICYLLYHWSPIGISPCVLARWLIISWCPRTCIIVYKTST